MTHTALLHKSKYPAIILCLLTLTLLSACTGSDDPYVAFKQGDYAQSFDGFYPRAEAGDVDAENYLGIHYYLGLGTDRDYNEAVKWFRSAALEKHPDAMRNLGVMYMRGFGVSQDWGKAYAWLYHAVNLGHKKAEEYLSVTADYVTPNKSMQQRKLIEEQIRAHERGESEQ